MTYNPNIPQPGDDPSDSQDQILQNFQTLNNLYGINGDHYPWTNQTGAEGAKHAKVTLPGLPTTNAPGNVVPVPANNELVAFALTAGGETRPFYRRDTLSDNIPLAPIIAFARANNTAGGTLLGIPFNIQMVAFVSPDWTFTFNNPEPDDLYQVFAFPFGGGGNINAVGVTALSIDAGSFTIRASTTISQLMVAALRYTL